MVRRNDPNPMQTRDEFYIHFTFRLQKEEAL